MEELVSLGGFVASPLAEVVLCGGGEHTGAWARILLKVGGTPAREAFETVLMAGPGKTSGDAARGLGRLAGEPSIEILMKGARLRRTRDACLSALAELGKEVGFDRLSMFLTPFPVAVVIEGLGRTKDPRAAKILIEALSSTRLAPAALRGLGHMGKLEFMPLLERAAFPDRTWKAALAGIENLDRAAALPFLDRYIHAADTRNLPHRARRARRAAQRIRGRR
jgi:uncharacterized protein YjeT (DUF2065 family)